MVRLDQQQIGAAQMDFDGIGHVAQICRDSDLDSLRAEAEANWIDSVMWDGETVDIDIAYREPRTGLEAVERGLEFFPIDGLRREARDEDRLAAFLSERD